MKQCHEKALKLTSLEDLHFSQADSVSTTDELLLNDHISESVGRLRETHGRRRSKRKDRVVLNVTITLIYRSGDVRVRIGQPDHKVTQTALR